MEQIPPHFEAFGERLKWWRLKRGYKRQGVFAEIVGLKQASLSNLETGESGTPSAATLLNLAAALNLRPEYLLTGEGPAEGNNITDLTGQEAMLVSLFRQLPSDALRDALLIDAGGMVKRTANQAEQEAVAGEFRLMIESQTEQAKRGRKSALGKKPTSGRSTHP